MTLAERIDLTRDLRELWALALSYEGWAAGAGPSDLGLSAERPFSAGNSAAVRYNELLGQRFGLRAISGVAYAVIGTPAPVGLSAAQS